MRSLYLQVTRLKPHWLRASNQNLHHPQISPCQSLKTPPSANKPSGQFCSTRDLTLHPTKPHWQDRESLQQPEPQNHAPLPRHLLSDTRPEAAACSSLSAFTADHSDPRGGLPLGALVLIVQDADYPGGTDPIHPSPCHPADGSSQPAL